MARKIRMGLLVLLLLGWLGWRYFQQAHPQAASAHAASADAAQAPPPPRMLGSIAFRPCTLAPQFGQMSVEAQCGSLLVAENPAAPNGRKIKLHIAWVPANEGADVAPDPVFMLAGGPGQAATDTYPQVAPAFREVLKSRNVILVDQRGTGQSNPLTCKDDKGEAALPDGTDMHGAEAARMFAERCRSQLSSHADLRFYTTTDAIGDLDAVRKAIGAARIDLIGISYGTRVAQQYAMRYPHSTRAIVLDSVAPNRLFLGNEFATNLESALDLQFGQCGKTPACARALGNPRSRLDALMTKLRADPPLVSYRDATDNQMHQEALTADDVAGLMRMYAYAPLASSLLPLELNEAANGRYEGLMALSRMLDSQMADQMTFGMQLSVVCSEDAAGFKADPDAEGTLLGNQFSDYLGAQCQSWPKGSMPADFHQPLTSDVPALVLEGEFDPVTPPRYGREVVRTLRNGRLLVLRGQGHNVIGIGCMPRLFAQFIENTNAKALDASCLGALPYVPPFTSFNGWEP